MWVLLLPANKRNSSFRILRFADGKLWITKTCLRAAAPGLAEWWRQGTMTLPTVPRPSAHLLPPLLCSPQPLLHDSTDRGEAAAARASERASSSVSRAALPHTTTTECQHVLMTYVLKHGDMQILCLGFYSFSFFFSWQEQSKLLNMTSGIVVFSVDFECYNFFIEQLMQFINLHWNCLNEFVKRIQSISPFATLIENTSSTSFYLFKIIDISHHHPYFNLNILIQ